MLSLLRLDSFRENPTERVSQALEDINCTGSVIPGSCTGYIQVLEVALKQPFKQLIKKAADLHYEQHEKE